MSNVIDLKNLNRKGGQPVRPEPVAVRPPSPAPAVVLPARPAPLVVVQPPPAPLPAPGMMPVVRRSPLAWEAVMNQSLKPRQFMQLGVFMAVTALAAWLLQKDMYLAVFFGVTMVVFILQSHRAPQRIRAEITAVGVSVGDRMHSYDSMKSFWVDYAPGGFRELSLEMGKWYAPYLKIPLGEQDPLRVRSVLVAYLPEEEHQPSLVDVWLKREDQ